ncbi:unnamed protein product [Paramecium pentaurelia]|uniref:Protein kinase domain-containing protein n=1 Tax=Paramecium pentaurelia TaxID=43138 RepID=A0A8S1XGC7_9CILI|nr:unnamed protein product [Paramecium pentaurelia]
MQQIEQRGDYIIKTSDLLGQGSFGRVLKCYKNINQDVLYCMKILMKPNISEKKIRNTLEAELKIYKQLKDIYSNNLVKLLDHIETDNEFCFVMELCDDDLDKLFSKYKKNNNWFNRQEQFDMIRQILKGAQILRKKKIVHRDIKPQNILVKVLNPNQIDQKRIFKLADFGFSKSLNDIYEQQDMTRVGTYNYLAPEIYYKDQFSGKCDIYSYGILFHQILFYRRYPGQYSNKEQLHHFFQRIKEDPYKCEILDDQDGKLVADLIEKMILYDQNKRISFEDLFQYQIILLKDPLFQPMFQINKFQKIDEDNQRIFQRIYTILDNLYRKSMLCKKIAEEFSKFNQQDNINILKIQYIIKQIGFYEIKLGFAMIHQIISDFLPIIFELCDVPHFISLLKLYFKENNPQKIELSQKIRIEFYSQQKTLTKDISDIKFKIYHQQKQQNISNITKDDHIFSLETLIEKQQIEVLCEQLQNMIDTKQTCEIINNYDIDFLKKIKQIPTIESRFDFFEYKLYESDQIFKL